MTLCWVKTQMESPFGAIDVAHWAVALDGGDDDIIDDADRALEQAEDELGAVMWNSNEPVLRFILAYCKNKKAPAGGGVAWPLRVLELGAGVGCLGIALAVGGCDAVVTDLPRLVPLMQKNVALNRRRLTVAPTAAEGAARPGGCEAAALKWGEADLPRVVSELLCGRGMRVLNAPAPSNAPKKHEQRSARRRKRDRACVAEAVTYCPSALTAAPIVVVLCDALYGNRQDWPKLAALLHELFDSANTEDVTVLNFCEQRVRGVEDDFFRMLDGETWAGVMAGGSALTAPPALKANVPQTEQSAALEVIVQDAVAGRVWRWEMSIVPERSGLDLPVRATVLTRTARPDPSMDAEA
jgi:hypothetical protein